MKNQSLSRRSFLVGSGAAMAWMAGGNYGAASTNANEKVNIGCIGVGGMGTNRLKEFAKMDDVNIVAVCDVDSDHADEAIAEIEKRHEYTPKKYKDFRHVLDNNDIDAVAIVTPDHWHAIPFIQACQASKDVFVEKPLCYTIEEGRAMVDAAKRYGRITQLGTHIHNAYDNYRRVVEMVQSGNLGEIERVHIWKTTSRESIGTPPNSDPPANLDYDFWLGPAPKRPYNPNRSHFNFRFFWDYSGGYFIDFWCHITDVAYWALDLPDPISVTATGRRELQDNGETPNQMEVLYEYPGMTLEWTLFPSNFPGLSEFGGIGCIFQGTKASLVTNYSKNKLIVDGEVVEDDSEEASAFPRPEPYIPNSPGHLREFIDSIKSRKETTCNVNYAYRLTKGGLLGNIAFRTGDKLVWNTEKERIVRNRAANDYLSREYRKPWKLG